MQESHAVPLHCGPDEQVPVACRRILFGAHYGGASALCQLQQLSDASLELAAAGNLWVVWLAVLVEGWVRGLAA